MRTAVACPEPHEEPGGQWIVGWDQTATAGSISRTDFAASTWTAICFVGADAGRSTNTAEDV